MKHVIEMIQQNKIIAIVRGVAPGKVVATAKALYEGGIRLMEVTFDQTSAVQNEDTLESIRALCTAYGDRMCIGAGTVMSTAQVEAAAAAGARYMISPNTDMDVIRRTVELGIVSIPGALTPSEISAAYAANANFIKVFPAGALGPSYIKAIRGPLHHIPLLAVGGIDENNMQDYLSAGAVGVGIGSNIVNNRLIDMGKFDELTLLAMKYTAQLKRRQP